MIWNPARDVRVSFQTATRYGMPMKLPAIGDMILVPVKKGPGAFVGECVISFDTLDGPVSGFIRVNQIVTREGHHFIQAKVLAVSNEGIVIDMRAASGLRIGQKGKYNHFKGIRNSAGKSVCQSNKFAGDVVVTEVQPDGTLVKADSFTETHESDTATFDTPWFPRY